MTLLTNIRNPKPKKIFYCRLRLVKSFEGLNSSSTFGRGAMDLQRHVQTAWFAGTAWWRLASDVLTVTVLFVVAH